MQAPFYLLDYGRLFQAQFTGQPEQVNFIAQLLFQGLSLTGGPARGFEAVQENVDAPVYLQHRYAFCLGRVCGDGRRHFHAVQQILDFLVGQASLCGPGNHVGKSTGYMFQPLDALRNPAPAHGCILFGDIEQLKPDPPGL